MEQLVVNAAEAAQMLNMSDRQTLEWLEHGVLPGYRIGRSWKVPIEDLRQFVSNRASMEAAERRKIYEEVQDQGE